MSTYLVGSSFVCAQGENCPITAPKPPAWQSARILDETHTLPYYRAFAAERLTLPALYALIDAHIAHTIKTAGWTSASLRHTPIFLGSTVYVIADREARFLAGEVLNPSYTLTEIAAHLRVRYHNPHIYNLATSCTSAAHGIAQAAYMIENGLCEQALVIGFESYNRMTFEHFHALGLLADAPESSGIILGEALACVALAARPHRETACRLHHIHCHTDSHNLTHNSAEGLRTLLTPYLDIPLASVKIHAAGGSSNDMEAQVLAECFPKLPQQAWKSATGHTLGASAALETALTLQHPPAHGQHLHYHLGFAGSNIAWLLEHA